MSLGLLAMALLGLAAGASVGTGVASGINSGYKGDGKYNTWQTWIGDTANSDVATAFKDYLKEQGYSNEYIDSLTDAEIGSLLKNSYEDGGKNFLGFGNKTLNFEDALKDLQEINNYRVPFLPDYNEIYQQAADELAAENAEVEALYDQLLNQQTTNLNQQMADLNNSYKDTTNQILSSDYINNRRLMDTATSELSKSRRNALEAGASAGLRLANNVNTMLSTQNQQAQQSLNTSNNLAQMMLNQRQAAAGIRGDYYNALSNNTAQKASLKQGNTERLENLKALKAGSAEASYNNDMRNWDSTAGNNPWSGGYNSYTQQQRQKSKYYGG